MKANELRIGNLVLYHGYHIATVHGITDPDYGHGIYINYDSSCVGCAFDMVEPIHLTEEWLKRYGFEVRESSTAKEFYIGENEITHDWLFSVVWLEKPELIKAPNAPFYRNGRHTIYYVHQLQNLYFALTGEELTIKEEQQ